MMNEEQILMIESQYLHGKVLGWIFYHLKYKVGYTDE